MAIAPLLGAFFGVGVTCFKNSLCFLPCECCRGGWERDSPDRGWPTGAWACSGVSIASSEYWNVGSVPGGRAWSRGAGVARRAARSAARCPLRLQRSARRLSPACPAPPRPAPRASGYRKPWEHVISGTVGAYTFAWVADKEEDMVKQIEEYYARVGGKQNE
jgi:hypothetical protein